MGGAFRGQDQDVRVAFAALVAREGVRDVRERLVAVAHLDPVVDHCFLFFVFFEFRENEEAGCDWMMSNREGGWWR